MDIITISGEAEAGKSTLAEIIKKSKPDQKVAIVHYGDFLKLVAEKCYGWSGLKDEEGRSLLQTVGTEKGRKVSEDFWITYVVLTAQLLEADDFDLLILPDCRFPNEIDTWKKTTFHTFAVHLERENHENVLTEEQRQHPSETALSSYNFDYMAKAENLLDLSVVAHIIDELMY